MQQITEASLIYYARRQCAEQWRVFLTVLAEELAQNMAQEQARDFMRNLGRRMALRLPHPDLHTLADLEVSINRLWEQMEWGYVRLREQADHVVVAHYCAPLRAAFGAAAIKWTPALLEGVYAQWFEAFGAGEELRLRQASAPRGSDDALEFHLARKDILDEVAG